MAHGTFIGVTVLLIHGPSPTRPIDHVLIVDADANRRAAWTQHLHHKALAVRQTAAVSEGVDYLNQSPVDLLILSGIAPDGNLAECLLSLRTRPVSSAVLWVMDAFGGIAEGWRQGVTDVLLKPDSNEELDLALERANRWRRTSQTISFLGHQSTLDAHQSKRDKNGDDVEDLSLLEKQHIFRILEKCQGNRTHAAKRLGISIRTLRN